MPNTYEPIRKYRKQRKPKNYSNLWIVLVIIIVLAGIAAFGMSLTGVGLFKDRPIADTTVQQTETTAEVTETEKIVITTEQISHDIPDDIEYTTISVPKSQVFEGDLILIDNDHPFVFPTDVKIIDDNAGKIDYKNLENKNKYIVSIYNVQSLYVYGYKVSTVYIMLRLDVIEHFAKMMKSFSTKKNFTDTIVTGGYRSYSSQATLYENNPTAAAKPGCSDYHCGATLFLEYYKNGVIYDMTGQGAATWLRVNACNYGFIFRYPSNKKDITGYVQPWQMRYIGTPHATYIAGEGLCLEEYLELMRTTYSPSNPLLVNCTDGWDYLTYYVPANADGDTTVSVPSNKDYLISGDNIGGFIVTVWARQWDDTVPQE